MKKIVKRCLPLLLALFSAMSAVAAPEEERPNSVLIMVDDMGFSDLGFMGGEIETPNLDRLAEDRTELNDLSGAQPQRAAALAARWLEWAREDKVYPKPSRKNFLKP